MENREDFEKEVTCLQVTSVTKYMPLCKKYLLIFSLPWYQELEERT